MQVDLRSKIPGEQKVFCFHLDNANRYLHTNMPFMKLIICCLFLLFSISLNAQQDNIDKFIEQQMKDQKIVGLSLGVIVNGKIVKAKGYGVANLEYNIPATENTVYKMASVSKHMIASAIMKLVEEGKLNLSDSITKFFKGAPPAWNKITIRHLMNHTSGLPRESPAFQPMLTQSDSLLIRVAYNTSMVFPTGTSWQYCNLGYFMLADIIRQISGKPFSRFMKDDIFYKYGLSNTQTTSLDYIVPMRANGYARYGGDTMVNAPNYVALRPSGAFLSTISDMMKWELLMQNNQMLTKKSWLQMWDDTVKIASTNSSAPPIYYGYGWNVSSYKNRKLVSHGGSLPGFRTIYYRFPDEKIAIVILTNSEPTNANPIAQGVADIILKN